VRPKASPSLRANGSAQSAAPLARNDVEAQLRDLAARFRASFAGYLGPLKFRGRRECRALDAPAASHAK
jgi:hypothetical protein